MATGLDNIGARERRRRFESECAASIAALGLGGGQGRPVPLGESMRSPASFVSWEIRQAASNVGLSVYGQRADVHFVLTPKQAREMARDLVQFADRVEGK